MRHIVGGLRSTILLIGAMMTLFAQPALAQQPSGAAAPALDKRTTKIVKTALERAAQAWGEASVVEASAAPAAGTALLTGEVAAAGLALVQAGAVVGATATALYLHMTRSGSIASYGNPYGMPARHIAFPLTRPGAQPVRHPNPYPLPTPEPEDDKPDEGRPGRVYATYTRYNRTTGRYYAGRTSAAIDLNKAWRPQAETAVRARHRQRHHDENPEPGGKGFRDPILDTYAVGYAVDYAQRYRDLAYLAIRGREQQLIDHHGARRTKQRGITEFRGGARSDTAPDEAVTENAIRAVAKNNPLGELFHSAANLQFGPLAPYTGDRI